MPLPQRKLHRLQGWDYSQSGYYFITICTCNKQKLLGHIHQSGWEATFIPTELGKMVTDAWLRTPQVYPNVKLDYFCLMPNHLHGILVIEKPDPDKKISIPAIIHGFKAVTTRAYNKQVPPSQKNQLWQGEYYDEIIRNDEMLYDIRRYIEGNPFKWLEDTEYMP